MAAEGQDMDSVTLATLCTQDIILGMADEEGMDRDALTKSIGEDVGSWGEDPSMTYQGFLKACTVLKGVTAPKLFAMTRDRLLKGWKPGEGHERKLGEGHVDAASAHMDVSSALLMDWDAVLEAIAKGTGRDIESVRGLFSDIPKRKDADTVIVKSRKHGKAQESAIGKLIRQGMKAADVDGGDRLKLEFDADD